MRNWVLGLGVLLLASVSAAQTPPWSWAGPKQLTSGSASAATLLAGPLDAVAVSTDASGLPLVLVGGDGGVWSLQAGTWSATGEALPVTALAVDTQNNIYAATSTAILASGKSWAALPATGLSGWPIRSLALSGPQLLALTPSGLYSSSDGGASFALTLAGTYSGMAVQGSSTLLVGAASGAWLTSPATAPTPVSGLPTSWSHATAAAALTGGFELLLTNADGSSSLWSVNSSGAAVRALSLPPLPGAPALALAVDAGGILWIADRNGLWSVQPDGTLADENAGLTNAAPLGFVLGSSDTLAVLDDGELAMGAASGWSESAERGDKLTALAQSAGVLTAIGGGTLWQSSDGGESWTSLVLPSPPTALASSAAGLWIGTGGGSLITPQGISEQVCELPLTAVTVEDSDLWAACGTAIHSSVDSGADWQLAATMDSAVTALATQAAWPGLVVAATASGVQWSEDSGKTWSSPVSIAAGAPVTALAFDASQTLWAATLGRGLWTATFTPPPPTVISLVAPHSASAGTSITIQATLEAGSAPDSGATIQFAASENNKSIWSASATTGSTGSASAVYTPTQAGTVALLVSDAANPSDQAQAAVSVMPAAAAKLEVIGGAGQSVIAGEHLPSPITVEADDPYGNPVPNVSVVFTGGQFSPASASTGTNGQVLTQFTTPPQPGTLTLTATAAALTVSWLETVLPPPDFSLTLVAPSAPPPPGQLLTLKVAVAGQGGFTQPVALLCAEPAVACSISPTSVTPGETATISISPPNNQASLPVTVIGSGSGIQHAISLDLTLQAFTLGAPGSSSLNVDAGSTSAAMALNLTSENGLSGPVSFTVNQADGTALPANLSPVFQPHTVALAASSQPVQVQFAIAASSAAVASPSAGSGGAGFPLPALYFLLLGATLLLVVRRGRRLVLMAGLALVLSACGGAPAPPPPPKTVAVAPQVNTYNLVLTATVANLTASLPVTVTVTTQ